MEKVTKEQKKDHRVDSRRDTACLASKSPEPSSPARASGHPRAAESSQNTLCDVNPVDYYFVTSQQMGYNP
jgi:hypothetical protein